MDVKMLMLVIIVCGSAVSKTCFDYNLLVVDESDYF